MRKLLSYLKQYKKEAILGPIFKLTETIFDLAVPIIFASLIDNGILKSDNNYIIKMTIVLVVLALFGIIVALIAQYFAAKASVGLGTKIRENLFKHIQTYSKYVTENNGRDSTVVAKWNVKIGKNNKIRRNSSSGGIFYVLAKEIINHGGIVYAACYRKDNVFHERIDKVENIIYAQKSKYILSNMSEIREKIKKDLEEEK